MLETARYADTARLVAECFDFLLPARQQTVAEHCAEHRYLQNEGGGYVGRWDHDVVPYIVEPMECLTSLDYLTVAVAGPGQSGKTSIPENWLLRSVDIDPAPMLWYMQTDEAVSSYVKDRMNPMIDGHTILRSNLGLHAVDDSLHYKRFRGMSVEFLAATYANMISKRAPRIVVDEIDAYLKALGDVKMMLDIRRQTYGAESMLLALSHPDLAAGLDPEKWTAGIMALWAAGDRRLWYWACPQCGAYSSPAPIASRVMSLSWDPSWPDEKIAADAHLLCPVEGCIVPDSARRAMNRTGRWVGQGQEIAEDGTISGELARRDTASFWILGVMSPFLLGGIGGLARDYVKAQREVELTGEDKTLRTVMSKRMGVPISTVKAVGSIDANTLAERARSETSLRLGFVPPGVRSLLVTVDCQAAHFEWLVRGFGAGLESWVIAYGRLPANPAGSAEDWDALFDQALTCAWPLAGQSGRAMLPRGASIDLGGLAGTSAQAYAAWRRWRRREGSPLRLYGKIAGRDAWSLLLTQGASQPQAPRLQVVYPDTQRKAGRLARGEVPVARFNANLHKDDLAGQLAIAEAGPLYVHVPAALRAKDGDKHPWFEQLVAETRDRVTGRWSKPHQGVRNEVLDLMVAASVLAELHGLTRIDWGNTPAWCADWDQNSMIVTVPQLVTALAELLPNGSSQAAAVPRALVVAKDSTGSRAQRLADRLA